MTGNYPKHNIPNGFLTPPAEAFTTNKKRGRSASVPGSERTSRSSLSRITLVDQDAQIATHSGLEDSDSIAPSKYSCLDHLLAILHIIFCIPLSIKMKMRSSGPIQGVPSDMESCPWVLPVLVLSTRRDTDKQPVPKRAKCTLDTGNMQGDIVSREFVEKILEYSELNFVPLTEEEKEGGFGVTGHKLVPEGAIYLTWYHNKSTRVFHDMRFLISPHSQCDLIIGARSIQKYNLLGVPNLMATTNTRVANSKDLIMDKKEEDLVRNLLKRQKSFEDKETELLAACKDTENDKDLKNLQDRRDVAAQKLEIRKAEIVNNKELVDELEKGLENLPGYSGDETSIFKEDQFQMSSNALKNRGLRNFIVFVGMRHQKMPGMDIARF
ncbi:hypothetical protein SBOR_6457 [Sclerotinia borealis F-4128]|uniref:Uncharacterized protein n=1 Tax=Sclerotinia borealis (strain F-4128) TaxID=1432307 RepID=W9CBH8_SCLBF|nr:hypothetical protein SBOR_6457 [Sclerotinia borealis F-4128]